ncbi:MAG TPA: ABC transporter ATP-binding protein [Thermoplasmata archaeon]|nr:ABC transporter ATP-binding protein [Thermoplasmata archaeon]
MAGPSIETKGLTKRYGSFTALAELNLKLEGAKCVGFLGPNGAGKTTTLKMLTDLIFPTAGEAFLNGISVRKERKRALAECGALIETPEIYPSLTPKEALHMVADLRGVAKGEQDRRIEEVLAEVKMSEWADKKVGKFSKGMKQRVNIAATLVSDPPIVMLDEPSSGLDPRGMAEVRDIIRGLKRHNRLIFFSSHILSEVTEVCDEVAMIDRGQLLFYDTLDGVTSKFSAGQTAIEVSFSRPVTEADVKDRLGALPGVTACERLDPRKVRLRLKGGLAEQERVFEGVASLHLGAIGFRESGNALEEIYMNQIEKGDR